jgi:hypothetical protein
MTAFNVVRFRVKPGREAEFTEAQRGPPRSLPDASALQGSRLTTGPTVSSARGSAFRASLRRGRK